MFNYESVENRLMMPAGFSFLGSWFLHLFISVILPATGKPLQSGSPWRISAAAGKDVILPCRLTASVDPSPVLVAEWSRVDGPFPVTVHVLRNGEELVKEKAPEYLGRTAIMEDGSLKLLGVQRRDNGTYRCVLLRGSSVEEFVSLTVAEVAEVKISVRRTSANELFVVCESSGWSPEPVVSLLDAGGSVLAAQTESSVRPDDLHSVRALVNVAAVKAALTGSGTVICRVELPEMSLANENKIYISDEFDPFEPGLGCNFVMVFAIVLVAVVIAVMLFAFPVWMIEKLRSSLRSSLRRLTEFSFDLVTQQRDGEPETYTEYGDITRVETTGASEETANTNQLLSRGIEASHQLAESDLNEMKRYKEDISSVGKILNVHPALIAGIISRQSRAGTKLSANGYGKFNQNCFGLMQISKHYHAVKGNPFSREHLDQGVTFFIQLIKTMKRTKQDWSKEQQLKGALACYIAGEERVIPLSYEEVDSVTPHGDFANDVVARAQWFAHSGF
ncbi:uncharacterized protein LOC119911594 isoform X2 [Micropterus salmoides]|uniref:uncharacterized protein LOC119911594 isoform X2 n=1 Tax=Micropterus salmoides TaxID=27706 RepID=UPI0018EAE6C0|nr:uncharacterized protein LOC119911594 isoform X2 [Micropterus salmoides]